MVLHFPNSIWFESLNKYKHKCSTLPLSLLEKELEEAFQTEKHFLIFLYFHNMYNRNQVLFFVAPIFFFSVFFFFFADMHAHMCVARERETVLCTFVKNVCRWVWMYLHKEC